MIYIISCALHVLQEMSLTRINTFKWYHKCLNNNIALVFAVWAISFSSIYIYVNWHSSVSFCKIYWHFNCRLERNKYRITTRALGDERQFTLSSIFEIKTSFYVVLSVSNMYGMYWIQLRFWFLPLKLEVVQEKLSNTP